MASAIHPNGMFDSSKLNAPTMAMIRRGFQHVHGREMTESDFHTLQLTDAKTYLAAGKTASEVPIASSKPVTAGKKPSKKKRVLVGSAVAIVGLMFLAPSEPSETRVIAPAAKSETVTSQSASDQAIDDAPAEATPKQVQSAQTTAPQITAPTPAPTPAPKPTPVAAPTPMPAAKPVPSNNCDPNYSGGCVPNVSHDLDCGDISFTVQVVGSDRHRFDGDKDGIGCE